MSDNTLIGIAVVGFMIGGSPWYFLSDIAGNEIDDRTRSAVLGALLLPAGLLLLRLRGPCPAFAAWANKKAVGLFALAVVFGLLTAGGSTLIAALNLPVWILVLAVSALYFAIGYVMLKQTMEKEL